MKVTHVATYDASAAEVYAMLIDPAFRQFCAQFTGMLSAEVKIAPQGGGHRIDIDQVQPTEGVPSFARKFAGETTRALQTETWTSPSEGDLVVQTPGRPTEIFGTYTLTDVDVDVDGQAQQRFTGEVKAKVPLIKDKLEKLVAQLFLEGKNREQAAGVAWLSGERS